VTGVMRIGVIGTGGMGGRHARNLALRTPGAQVVGIMDMDEARATEVAAACGGARVFTDAATLIADPGVDALVIASPDHTHASLASACISAEKPVLCEKPLATSAEEAESVVRNEVAAGRRLVQLGFMREYDPAHLLVFDAVKSGRLGRPLYFRGAHANLGGETPRTIDDVIINSAVHDIHSARWLLGGKVTNVYTQIIPAVQTQPDTCRLALIEMRFDHGALALIELNADSGYGYDVRVEVVGEMASVSVDGLQPVHLRQSGSRLQTIEADWLQRFEVAYIEETAAWVRALLAGEQTGPSTWDGYIAMKIADACIESARSGLPIAVEEPDMPAIYREKR
jgi:myo-inositol 2-dehydrogenase/D-chiro-inositol 1-dehydrogenase